METSNEINELASAMVKFQQSVESPKKSSANPAFKREGKSLKYADLDAIIKVVTPALSANGLSQMQFTSTDIEQKSVTVTTMLIHSSGQYMKSDALVLPAENFGKFNAQTIGSSITYGRRYSLSAMLGIASEDDDDANAQSQKNNDNSGNSAPPNNNQNNNNNQQPEPPNEPKNNPEPSLQDSIVQYVDKLKKEGVDIQELYSDIARAEGVKHVREADNLRIFGHLKAYYISLHKNQEQSEQNHEQGSILEGRTTKPVNAVPWGEK